jgi:hypothetical protein
VTGIGLAIAHPGHELRLLQWVAAHRPTIYVLTAGSRSGDGACRVDASRELAARLGATPGAIFGRHLDREVYGWIMAGDHRPFADLAAELADSFVARRLRSVVTDSWQLYNVVHDLWHLTVRAAAGMASERLGRVVDCLDYPVVPTAMARRAAGPATLEIRLSPAEVEAKLRVAADFPEIADDVAEVAQSGGLEFLATETLHAVRPLREIFPQAGEKPLYEEFGEARVAAGLYDSVLRWRHVEPIAAVLGDLVGAVETA